MGFKTIVYFGLLLAALVLITSEATDRELAETSTSKLENTETAEQQTMGVEEANYPGGYGGGPGKGCRYRCRGRCCTYEEVMMMEKEYYGGGPGKGCRYRCRGRCCTYEEVMLMEKEYYGGGPGKGCRYKCHGRCCSYEEAMMEKGN